MPKRFFWFIASMAIVAGGTQAIRDGQPASMRGSAVIVPVLEAMSAPRIGRFGWKDQHASLESFAADAYLNEMGVASTLFPLENTISGDDPADYDEVDDPEDEGEDVVASITTSPAGTPINGGVLKVHAALGNKVIHPYSDFLMHDIATGDGIPIQPTAQYASTANQIRTAPLWGLLRCDRRRGSHGPRRLQAWPGPV